MLSQKALDALAKLAKLTENEPWNQSTPKRPTPAVMQANQRQLSLLALVRSERTKPVTQDHRSKPADIYEVRTTPGGMWFPCIVIGDPVTRKRPTLEQLQDIHRKRWGAQCETRRRRLVLRST